MQRKDEGAPLLPLPPDIELIAEYDAVVIRRRWKSIAAYFLVFFALLWNAFMVVWMSIAFSQGIWTMAAFGSLHAGVGLGLIYFTIASFINKTDIRIDTYNLSIRHGPAPWFGNADLPCESIAQVFCKEKVSRNKNGTSITYEVHCLDRNDRSKKLLSGFNDPDQARYIEQQIERTLGIADRSVSGELRK